MLSGSRISSRLNSISNGDSYSSSSSRTSAACSISITIGRFCSSSGASWTRYSTKACSRAVSLLTQNGSLLLLSGGVVAWMSVSIMRSASLSLWMYLRGL